MSKNELSKHLSISDEKANGSEEFIEQAELGDRSGRANVTEKALLRKV